MEYTGEFETHLTVCLAAADEIDSLRQWSANHGLKCLHIVLDRGVTISQPMLTRRGQGDLSDELERALSLGQTLNAEGFRVTRIKIEAAVWNQDVPQSRAEAERHPATRYFEHHVKLLLDGYADSLTLAGIADQHSAHLSRNALQVRGDGRFERFVTQRCRSV